MTPRSPSPPLIKGIDGIVSRPPNEVNYSTLNGKNMETRKQPGNEIRQKFKKYGLRQMERYYVKPEVNVGKYEYLMEPGNQNEIEVMEADGEDDGEDWCNKRGTTTAIQKSDPKYYNRDYFKYSIMIVLKKQKLV